MKYLLEFTKMLKAILLETGEIIKLLDSSETRRFRNKLRRTIKFLLTSPVRQSKLSRFIDLITGYCGLATGCVAAMIFALLSVFFCYSIYNQFTGQAFLGALLSFALLFASVISAKVCSVLCEYSQIDLKKVRKRA